MKRRVLALVLVLLLAGMLTSCGLQVPRPEIKEGRFDFSITYQIGEEVETFSAVYVCEFAGTSLSVEVLSYNRDWEDHTEGEYEYEGDDYAATVGKTADGGDIILFFGVYPEYFMGDSTGDRGAPEPSIYVVYPEDEDGAIATVGTPEEVEALYGAKIISSEYAAPVVNTFTVFDFN